VQPESLLVYVVSPQAHSLQSTIEALRLATTHEYVVLHTPSELYLRLRRGSIRPRLILLDDGPPTSKAWVGAHICRFIKSNFEDSPPIIVLTTDQRRHVPGYGQYRGQLTRAGAVMTISEPVQIPFLKGAIEQAAGLF